MAFAAIGYNPTIFISLDQLIVNHDWDPTIPDGSDEVISPKTSHRIMKDVMQCVTAEEHQIFVALDSDNILFAHAVIVGPKNTPYEGGFFYFIVKFPANYPLSPPKVKLMTTDQNSVRFNPNFYETGMICTSMLGTFDGPGWRPVTRLLSLLLSIQSLMSENPYLNEPGVSASAETIAKNYAKYIQHETIRVAVIDMMKEDNFDTTQMPMSLRESINKVFKENISIYFEKIKENEYLNGTQMHDPFNVNVNGIFEFESLRVKMIELTNKHLTDQEADASDNNGEHSEISDLSE